MAEYEVVKGTEAGLGGRVVAPRRAVRLVGERRQLLAGLHREQHRRVVIVAAGDDRRGVVEHARLAVRQHIDYIHHHHAHECEECAVDHGEWRQEECVVPGSSSRTLDRLSEMSHMQPLS